ncbi:MAG: carbohydrate binding family 9 domain-containing protein [Balneolaceae bacterium]|nr:carbohydrate binding family 9 domain-containing protein [Balneolaceae bacterium]
MKISAFVSLLLSLTTASVAVYAQNSTTESNSDRFKVRATFTENAPNIDGKLNDPLWSTIQPVTHFTQIWPDEGELATEESEVRIAYDRDHLYFAFTFFDKNPELIRAKNLERGGRNDRDDHVFIGLDTYQDGRNAYLFEVNALGTQDDAYITDETMTFDSFSWDAVYRSETRITDKGWTLEVSIPFRQLRFPEGDDIDFGLMIARMINRKNERVLWPPIGLEHGGSFRALAAVSQYGELTGIKNIRRGKNIEIKPYVISGAQEVRPDLESEATDIEYTYDIGGDFKYGITSNLTLDMTVNTDFAQVEADDVQLNLTRFSLFFPEKREFFLERAGLFDHGNRRSTQTFFSRRIGLNEQILAGARLTGQAGKFSVGALNIETGDEMAEFLGSRSTNNTVARLRTDLFPRATVGTIFTNLEDETGYNRALGFDAQYRFWGSSEFSAWYTNVWDDDPAHADEAGHLSFSLRNDLYGGEAEFNSVGANYNPALGFVQRRDMRQYKGGGFFNPTVNWDAVPFIRRFNFRSSYDYIEGQDGQKQSTKLVGMSRIEFNRRDRFQLIYARQFERLTEPFNIRPNVQIAAGDYTFNRIRLRGETDSSRRTYFTGQFAFGEFFGGDRYDWEAEIGFRQSKHLQMEGSVKHSDIKLPVDNGHFDATTISLSVLGAVNRKLFAKALLQYDNFSRDFNTNIRIDWIHTPGSDLFLVFNTSYHLAGDNEDLFDPRKKYLMNSQAAIVKLTYLISL